MNSNLAPAAATTALVTAVAQPPATASANINQMLSSLAPMQPPSAHSPATAPAAESAPSTSPSKKAKKRKKDEVDAAVGTPSRSQVRSTIHFHSKSQMVQTWNPILSPVLRLCILRTSDSGRTNSFLKICSDFEMSLEPRVSETRKSELLQSSLLLITEC